MRKLIKVENGRTLYEFAPDRYYRHPPPSEDATPTRPFERLIDSSVVFDAEFEVEPK